MRETGVEQAKRRIRTAKSKNEECMRKEMWEKREDFILFLFLKKLCLLSYVSNG